MKEMSVLHRRLNNRNVQFEKNLLLRISTKSREDNFRYDAGNGNVKIYAL